MKGMDALDPLATPPRRLLLVEDDADLASMLTELLAEEGYAVTTVRDGQAGLHRGLVEQWDVLVVDRGLPVIEGVDLVSRLRSKGMSAPVLLLTARGTVADRVEGLDAGAQDYLVKPFDVDELLARLRALLRPLGAGATELAVSGSTRSSAAPTRSGRLTPTCTTCVASSAVASSRRSTGSATGWASRDAL